MFAFRRLSVLYAPSSDELLFLALSRSVVGEDKAGRVGPTDKRIARLGYQSDIVVCLKDLLSRISAFGGEINDPNRELLMSGRTILRASSERKEKWGSCSKSRFLVLILIAIFHTGILDGPNLSDITGPASPPQIPIGGLSLLMTSDKC